MRHILVRYGGESVNQWKFELWFDAERLDDEAYICDYAKTPENYPGHYSSVLRGTAWRLWYAWLF